jgi:hypothetical protein
MLRKAAILASITQALRVSPFAGQTLADEVTGCGMTGHATLIAEQIRISSVRVWRSNRYFLRS